mmetsp:Transcript_1650/g.4411  ORF Transcript_1650/g.4411 Transcript_1650/m.4411 type:complete len:583 (-) Transcript_1650:117-1865(-)|eukprot:CAMPEP_0113549238 /NCGR_PEP_ID=MMETSP0015_2-20120614/13328_1 /TAXON_ID=2838 /ORGANISM="Odontella" /LENGTH=582 /DNA_ID=CAMNT_0000449937 /DNA_START=301 /DNA_END=2049 /DNA_ORIENTATION=- /assembly_acc=CAM_ASM_000160
MARSAPVASTYVAGDDPSRLKDAAAYLGLDRARRPTAKVREAVSSLLFDSTLESARMHSVGTLAKDERVDEGGTIHLMTLNRRTRDEWAPRPEYGNLMDVFQQQQPTGDVTTESSDEYEVVDTVEGGSLGAAAFGIVKGTVGPAILFLPRGFKLAGWAVAIPALLFSTVTYLYSAGRLLECWKIEKRKVEQFEEIKALLEDAEMSSVAKSAVSGSETCYGATESEEDESSLNEAKDSTYGGTLLTYPELARKALGPYAVVVSTGIAVLQFGVCLTYFIFIPENMVQVTRAMTGLRVKQEYFLVCMVLMEIPFSWVRDIRKLTPTNILATILIAFGLASCLGIALFKDYGDSNLVGQIAGLPPLNSDTWYMFIGTSFYMFEGAITLVLPLQEAVFTKEDKAKFPSLKKTVMWCIVVFYIFFAITCWAAYGEGLKTAMTASLPDGALATSVQVAYSVAVFFTFPLQAFPALEVTLKSKAANTGKRDCDFDSATFRRNVEASILICCLGVVAYFAQDYLGNVASLLGSLVGVPIGLVFPNLMHNALVKDSSPTRRAMNYGVASVGLIASVMASTTTILNWSAGAE